MHPVAGRCKHCKAELASARAARPRAAAALPLLGDGAAPVAIAAAHEPSQPVLPPQPMLVDDARPSRGLRNWPVIVIAVAGVAIVAAVILMVWPDHHDVAAAPAGDHALAPPPAPERMDTDPHAIVPTPVPAPTPAPIDPSDPNGPNGGPHAQLPPTTNRPAPVDPNDPNDLPDPDLSDPLGQLLQPGGGGGGVAGGGVPGLLNNLTIGPNAAAFQMQIMKHLCDRLSKCDPSSPLSGICGMSSQLGSLGSPPTCPAARTCLEMVDGLSCNANADPTALLDVFARVHSCVEALSC